MSTPTPNAVPRPVTAPARYLPRDAMLSQAVPIQSYLTYAEAERAVDHLSDARFPVERVAIVGTDLRLVESVTGRLTLVRAGLAGAATGVWLGLMIALFTAVFVAASFTAALLMLLWGILLGAAFGALFGVVAHALTGGRRDFSSRSRLVAGRYDIMIDAELAEQARPMLQFAGGNAGRTTDRPRTGPPPSIGNEGVASGVTGRRVPGGV